jgi:hypothetical protein
MESDQSMSLRSRFFFQAQILLAGMPFALQFVARRYRVSLHIYLATDVSFQ